MAGNLLLLKIKYFQLLIMYYVDKQQLNNSF